MKEQEELHQAELLMEEEEQEKDGKVMDEAIDKILKDGDEESVQLKEEQAYIADQQMAL